jgi:hypothetical protein
MTLANQIIYIQPSAPTKPPFGAACNGCGVCCLIAPCPLGMVLSRKRRGACVALRWNEQSHQYRCGAITAPREVAAQTLPTGLGLLAPALAWALSRVAKRWISAGTGCDSDVEPDATAIKDNAENTLHRAHD